MKRVKVYFNSIYVYLADNREQIILDNWGQAKIMTLVYMAVILLFLLAISIPQGNAAQNILACAAFAAQALFSTAIWIKKSPPKTMLRTNLLISVFGYMIAAFAYGHDVFVFTQNNAWIAPIVIILLTQIYTMPPVYKFVELSLLTALFIVGFFIMKPFELAAADSIALLTAFCVAMVSYFTIMSYRTAEAQTRKQLLKMCATDQMTGLLNKSTFEYYYDEFSKSDAGNSFVLAVVDMDRFKDVNDKYGHLKGDAAIKILSESMERSFRIESGALLGRFGGDEFLVLIKNPIAPERIKAIFGKFVNEFSEEINRRLDFNLTISVGAVFFSERGISFDKAFKTADEALYVVKNEGGNDIKLIAEKKY